MDLLGFWGLQTVDTWLEAGGYAALFGILLLCGLGLPVPEDIPLLIAGAFVAKERMHLATAGIVAWCGIIGGDIILYCLGRRFGLEITRVPFIGKHLTKERIERVESMFEQYGVFVVAVGRLFAGVRGAMVVAAGAIRFNFLKFIITDSIAAVISGGFFIAVGYWLGNRLNENTMKEFKHIFIAIASVLAVGLIGWILWRRRRAEERVESVAGKVEHITERVAHVAHLPKRATDKPAPDAAPPIQGDVDGSSSTRNPM